MTLPALSPPPSVRPAPVRCRAIRPADGPAIAGLLSRGFPDRTAAYWATAVDRLLCHAAALADPACGAVLESERDLVGVLLLVGASDAPDGSSRRRCNVSSWFVDPRFQAYAPLLASQATKRKDVTYFNISPATHTWPTIEALGFVRYGAGRVLVAPALLPPRRGVRVQAFDPGAPRAAGIGAAEQAMLIRHAGYGCLAVTATTPDGVEPFLFLRRTIGGRAPGVQLVYCRSIAAFAHLAGPVGRYLLRRGVPLVMVDACGALAGLRGWRLADRSPKYAKGPAVPRTGDLTDTELVMFGP